MMPNTPEMAKMVKLIENEEFASIETYTYEMLSSAAEENLFVRKWLTDGRRDAIRFGMSVLFADPLSVTSMSEVLQYVQKGQEFIHFLLFVETAYGLEGWNNIFNTVANNHTLETVYDFEMMDFFEDLVSGKLEEKNPMTELDLKKFMDDDNLYAVMDIPDVEDAWKEMVSSGTMFHEGFESEWE
tara:strand:+ start:307 stop:861 length:555 start_codon:yes stop_codon:yes gene_type:complete